MCQDYYLIGGKGGGAALLKNRSDMQSKSECESGGHRSTGAAAGPCQHHHMLMDGGGLSRFDPPHLATYLRIAEKEHSVCALPVGLPLAADFTGDKPKCPNPVCGSFQGPEV